MSSPVRVVISAPDDNQIPYVEQYLDEPFLLLNTRDILQGNALTYSVQDGKTVISKAGRQIKNVQSIWYRRWMLVQGFELPVAEGKQKYAQDSIKYFNRLLFTQFADALWVSDFFAIEKANDKLWQLQVAASLGLNIPDTLITTSASEAQEFVGAHKSVIAKPNYSARYEQGDKEYVFFTSRVNSSTDFSGLHLAPAILQEEVPVKHELRITVVGKTVFAASVRIDKSEINHIRDWRLPNLANDATIEAFDLPRNISDKCVALVKKLGLQFGAIDMIVDTKDRYWFLENNPSGQWGFVEEATGQPIGKAIAELLMSGK